MTKHKKLSKPKLSNIEWNPIRNQAILKVRGRPIVTYAPNTINFNEVTEFYEDLEKQNPKNPVIIGHDPPDTDLVLSQVLGYRMVLD